MAYTGFGRIYVRCRTPETFDCGLFAVYAYLGVLEDLANSNFESPFLAGKVQVAPVQLVAALDLEQQR